MQEYSGGIKQPLPEHKRTLLSSPLHLKARRAPSASSAAAMTLVNICIECSGYLIECIEGVTCTACGLVNREAVFVQGFDSPAETGSSKKETNSAISNIIKKYSKSHVNSKERWCARLREMASPNFFNDNLIDTAVDVYSEAVDTPGWKIRKNDNQLGVLAACIFHSCNIHKGHRTPTEICAAVGVDPRNARRMVKVTQNAADKVKIRYVSGNTSCTDVCVEVIPRCAQRLVTIPPKEMSKYLRKVRMLYNDIKRDIDNHRPDTIAAGLLSITFSRMGIEDKDVADACLVSVNTVRTMTNKILSIATKKMKQ